MKKYTGLAFALLILFFSFFLNVTPIQAQTTCTPFSDDFSGTSLDVNNWNLISWTNGFGTVSTGTSLNIHLPASSETTAKSTFVETKKVLTGDFTSEITMVTRNDNPTYQYFQFNAKQYDGGSFEGGFGFRLLDSSLKTEVYGVDNPTNPGPQDHEVAINKDTPVKLKLEKIGTTVKMSYDLMDGQGYRLLRTFDNFITTSGYVIAGVQHTGSSNLDISGIFDDYNQTCLDATPTTTPPPNSPTPTGIPQCVPFTDTFPGTTYTANWTLKRTLAGKGSATVSATGVRLSMPVLPALTMGQKGVELISKKNLIGNFSAVVVSKSATVTTGKKQGIVSFVIAGQTATGVITQQQIRIQRLLGQPKLQWQWNQNPNNWSGVQKGIVTVTGLNDTKLLKFRLVRKGLLVYIQYSIDGIIYKNLKTITSFTDKPVRIMLITETRETDYPASSGTFDDLKVSCPIANSPTNTPIPTPTGGPTVTPNPACACASSVCSNECTFNKHTDVVYSTPIKCDLPTSVFLTTPSDTDKNSWCQRLGRTKGDADGLGPTTGTAIDNVTQLDYMYYVSAVNGAKIASGVNPDFNGDGEVGVKDREIIMQTLGQPTP